MHPHARHSIGLSPMLALAQLKRKESADARVTSNLANASRAAIGRRILPQVAELYPAAC